MQYSKKIIAALSILGFLSLQTASAFEPKETARYFNGPTVSSVTDISAELSLSLSVLAGLTEEEKQGVYFEYGETEQRCIMIYPTPDYCLPKKTEVGKISTTITNLKPNTSYTVTYKRDNTIRCITTPCPGNEFQSNSIEFRTKSLGGGFMPIPQINKNLWIGNRDTEVTILQKMLIERGYLRAAATGYFGVMTRQAVYEFQRAKSIIATGFVGPLTRAALKSTVVSPSAVDTETFEGIVTAFSTGCFADGECSISVDGKKVITTTGWSQETVGSLRGVLDLGEVEKNIGARAKVYAKKVEGGYSLYGSADYYVEIFGAKNSTTTASPRMSFFITSKNLGKGADFGGLDGADAYCASLAKNAEVSSKTWKAYLSTVSKNGTLGVNARDRIGNGPWYNYHGELIATDLNELHGNNKLTKQTALTEKGGIVFGRGDSINIHDILTGSNEFGMSVATTTDTTCNNWTSGDQGGAYVGHHDRIGINESAPMKSWNSSHVSRGCSLPALRSSGGGGLIYCFAK